MKVGGLLVLAIAAALAVGCESYSERTSCTNGTVFDDDGDCVLPPSADAGAAFETCAELCAMIPGWTAAEVQCLQDNLARALPLPAECEVLDTSAECDACVIAAGADDLSCALSNSCL